MGGRNIGQAVLFYLLDNRFARFRHDSFMPKFFTKSIAKIVVFFHIHFDVASKYYVICLRRLLC